MDKIINKKIAGYWNRRGETYSRSWQSVAKKRLSNFEIAQVINIILSVKKITKVRTLDIGVGTGRISGPILKHTQEHYGTDVSKIMVDYCKQKFKKNKNLKQIVVHDILNPVPKNWGKFDVISAIRVLSYTKLWRKELKNIYQVLKPGGYLVFTFPNKNSSVILTKLVVGKKYQGCEVTYRELTNVLKNIGFRKIKIQGFSRLLDTFYDQCNSKTSANILLGIEKALNLIFGTRIFTRLFYVTCKK